MTKKPRQQKADEDKFVNVGTKITPHANKVLERLARKFDITKYDLLQMFCDVLVRYTSDQYNLQPEMQEMMRVFEHTIGWKDAANVADPSARWEIQEATYYLTAHGRKGVRAVHVQRPFMGNWMQTENISKIFELTLNYLMPERYLRLRQLGASLGITNMVQLIDRLIDRYDIDEQNLDEIRRSFEDCNRAQNNQPVEYGQRTRRKKHRTPDNFDIHPEINFHASDVPDLPELHEHDNDNKPFDPDRDAIGI